MTCKCLSFRTRTYCESLVFSQTRLSSSNSSPISIVATSSNSFQIMNHIAFKVIFLLPFFSNQDSRLQPLSSQVDFELHLAFPSSLCFISLLFSTYHQNQGEVALYIRSSPFFFSFSFCLSATLVPLEVCLTNSHHHPKKGYFSFPNPALVFSVPSCSLPLPPRVFI